MITFQQPFWVLVWLNQTNTTLLFCRWIPLSWLHFKQHVPPVSLGNSACFSFFRISQPWLLQISWPSSSIFWLQLLRPKSSLLHLTVLTDRSRNTFVDLSCQQLLLEGFFSLRETTLIWVILIIQSFLIASNAEPVYYRIPFFLFFFLCFLHRAFLSSSSCDLSYYIRQLLNDLKDCSVCLYT